MISLQDWQPLPDIPDTRLRLFAQYTHRLLRALGTAPHDVEIHHGEGFRCTCTSTPGVMSTPTLAVR